MLPEISDCLYKTCGCCSSHVSPRCSSCLLPDLGRRAIPGKASSEISLLFQTGESDVEVTGLWKTRRTKPAVRSSESPHTAFRRWRKSASLKLTSDPKGGSTEQKIVANGKDKNAEEEMSLLKFLAIVSNFCLYSNFDFDSVNSLLSVNLCAK